MQKGYTCPTCGEPLWFVNQYQNWYCDRCKVYPFTTPSPMPTYYYPPPGTSSSNMIILAVVIVVIIFVVLPIALAAFILFAAPDPIIGVPPPPDEPIGEMVFVENSVGNYTGGLIILNERLNLNEVSLLIIDESLGEFGQLNPLEHDGSAQVFNGIRCTFSDSNQNNRLDVSDIFTVENGAPGDTIRLFLRPTDDLIAEFILT